MRIEKEYLILATLLLIFSIITAVLPPDIAKLHNYIFTSIFPLLSAYISYLIYSNSEGDLRKISLSIALFSFLCWLAEITWNCYEIAGYTPFPSIADLFYISSYIPLMYILIYIFRKRMKYSNIKIISISAICTYIAVQIFYPSILVALKMDLLSAVLSLLYIFLDILSLALSIPIILLSLGDILCLGVSASVLLTFIGDVLFNYYESMGYYYTGSLPDVFYNLSYSILFFTMYIIYKKRLKIVDMEHIIKEKELYALLNKIIRHDLLNEITSAILFLEMAIEDKRFDYVEKVLKKLENIVSQINLLRSVERRDKLGKINLREVVKRVVDMYNFKVKVDVPDVEVVADELIYSVIRNLIENAIKYGGNNVYVKADLCNDWVYLKVCDNGPGIPDEEKEKIFELGYGKGRGIGLYIVKSAVNMFGGDVWVEDNKPKGSIFVVKLKRK